MKLYKIELNGLGTHYVISTDPTAAYQTIRNEYDAKDYGFSRERTFKTIEQVAEDSEYPDTKRLWLPR